MTLRQKFAADQLQDGDAEIQAALLIALYEYGDTGVNKNDPTFLARVQTLSEMTDEQFAKEHQRVMFEMGPGAEP